ncbi:EAL domain-containing protein [Marinimicrococcus flavescens]|uniref:EAL domain-containing protein n=1 Tax=Marinimicrococcus flavescens TaxID=3031815 RepID=A0AAP3XS39_9PROT|nr:EAL domain-containing protein [Marinimicrococcus flavescens]
MAISTAVLLLAPWERTSAVTEQEGLQAQRAWLAGSLAGLRVALKRQIVQLEVGHVLTGRPAAPLSHLPESLWQLDIDFAFLVGEVGLTVHGMIDGRPTTATAHTLIGDDLDALLAAVEPAAPSVASGFVLTRSGLALAAVTPTTHRGGRALLVVGELLDPDLLGGIAELLTLPGLRFEQGTAGPPRSFALRTRDGALLGSLVWDGAGPQEGLAGGAGSWGLLFVLAVLTLALAVSGPVVVRKARAELRGNAWIEKELRQALRAGALDLHYQPQIDMRRGVMSGAEALLRWSHPTRGTIPPSLFIPVAEKAGLMPELGGMVLRRATAEAARWGGLKVAVNVSPLQFRRPGLVAQVREALAAAGLAASLLELEITESALLDDPAAAFAKMRRLQQLGVRIAIDDFGTGYSSLSYLHRFPFDKIKIDRSFTEQLLEHAASRAVVEAVVRLARDLDASLCAEGIERKEQAALLATLGFDEAQGFLFARPMPAEELRALRAAPPAAWSAAI